MYFSALYIAGFVLIAAAFGLMYYVLRGNPSFRPRDAFQWTTVAISSIVVVFALLMIAMVATVERRGPVDAFALETADLRPGEMDAAVEDFAFRHVTTDEPSRLSALHGKVVLVNIWATWCAPCRFELPELNRLQADYRDAGLVVLNLSDESREDLLTYQNELPLETLSAYVDPVTVPEPLRRNFQVRPTSFVIDRQGILRESALGMRSYDQFLTLIEPYLNSSTSTEV
ncbi:MAG TPA: TlpA disulfide reductase family protein [Rhodothermales bacterium]